MKKLLRKITALVLVFILTGLCCANAAGSSGRELTEADFPIVEDYDNGRFVITATASISQKMTQGSIWETDNAQMMTDVYRSVSVTYRYLVEVGVNTVEFTDTESYTARAGDLNANVYIYMSDIYHMVNAHYTFAADVPCSYGTQRFQTEPQFIRYNNY